MEPLPALGSIASLVSFRDLRAQEETLEAWEGAGPPGRGRRLGQALGAGRRREAQRRLRMRLLQDGAQAACGVISRVLRGKPAKLGLGPPLRASERKPDHWD